MVNDSRSIGRRRRGAVLVRNGWMVAEEEVASGKSSGMNSWRRAIASNEVNSQCASFWSLKCGWYLVLYYNAKG